MDNSWETYIKGGKQRTLTTPFIKEHRDWKKCWPVESAEKKLEEEKPEVKDFKSVLKTMVGGAHYQPDGTIQPIEFYKANPQLDFQQTNVIKYIYRFKDKNGLQDLLKVIHYTLIAAEFGYDKKEVDEFKQKIVDMLK